MDTLDCIKTRRSKRRFVVKDVPKDMIEKIIDAGKCAPSSHDSQPWQFFVVKEQKLKEAYAKIDYDENKESILTCDFILVICVDKEKSPVRFVEDGVLAAQNIALAIHDLGLGSVYLSAYKKDDQTKEQNILKLFNIPEDLQPVCLILVGYPDAKEELEKKTLRNNGDLIEYR